MKLVRFTKVSFPSLNLEPDFYIRSDTIIRLNQVSYQGSTYRVLVTTDGQNINVTESAADIAKAINAALP